MPRKRLKTNPNQLSLNFATPTKTVAPINTIESRTFLESFNKPSRPLAEIRLTQFLVIFLSLLILGGVLIHKIPSKKEPKQKSFIYDCPELISKVTTRSNKYIHP